MVNKNSRRSFIKKLAATTAALTVGTSMEAKPTVHILKSTSKNYTANDKIRLGLIGAGIIGHYDMDTALKFGGVELAAVCDLYTGRLDYAKEKWGDSIFTTRDYREVLVRKDVDAVLVCTPDHWHDVISIDAMNAGKHVYCEKPMVHKVEQGLKVIAAQKRSGKVFQVGSQWASGARVQKAQEYFKQGIIGELTYVEAVTDRVDSRGAWNYSIPTDASPQTVDFDRFLGRAPKVPFDATRFFRWRNYKDYGTGVAGDLFVHLYTILHTVTGAIGPNRIYSLGELNYWKDGRDAYDLVTGIMEYPQTANHPSFQMVARVNLADGVGGNNYCKLVGTEGVIELGGSEVRIKHLKRAAAPGYGGYDSYNSFSAKQKEDFKKWYTEKYGDTPSQTKRDEDIIFKAEKGQDDRYDHFKNFFESIRTNKPVFEDAIFGLRAAAPSLLCNLSAEKGKVVKWDPVNMKVIK
jgi:predicted dehydrogenase